MARRYLMDAVFESIDERPIFTTSREIKDDVNKRVKLKGWNRNISTVQIGQIVNLLVDERRVFSRPKSGKDRIKEFISISALRQVT